MTARSTILAALLSVTLLAGCGGGDDPGTRTLPAPPPARAPAPAGIAALPEGVRFGIHATLRDLRGGALAAEARLAARTGAGVVREDLSWATIEPRPGRRDWGSYDRVVEAAARAGLRVHPILLDTPPWQATRPGDPPAELEAFGRFAAAAARRYGPGGSFWQARPALDARLAAEAFELYNEPYLHSPEAGGFTPAEYATLVRGAGRQIRDANPGVDVLMAGELTWIDEQGTDRGAWLAAIYDAFPDFGQYFDGLAVHPYAPGHSPKDSTAGQERWDTGRIERLRELLELEGDADRPVWITEIGWSTCDDDPEECVTEAEQAAYLAELAQLVGDRWQPWLVALYVYQLRDTGGDGKEGAFGLLRADGGEPKPAWPVVQAISGAPRRDP